MDPDSDRDWGERLAEEGARGTDPRSTRQMVADAIKVVGARLGDIRDHGINPLLHEAAAQVRPATHEELQARYPGLREDEVAKRLIDRAALTAGGVALAIGGVLAAQEAIAVVSAAAPPAGGAALGAVGVTALAEVLVLFVLEAKLRADLGALAGQPSLSPRELVSGVVSEVQAAGGWTKLRGTSLRRVIPEAAARRVAAQVVKLVPSRFARIVIPEVIAPLIGAAFSARLAVRQVRAAGQDHWERIRTVPRTTVTWGAPSQRGSHPAAGRHPSAGDPGDGGAAGATGATGAGWANGHPNGGPRGRSSPSDWGPSPDDRAWRQELPPPPE
jgi:hypothetical protein